MRQTDPFFYVPSQVAAAPWHLRGNGYVFLFRHSKSFLREHAFLCEYQRPNLKAGLGAVILADYQQSEVGPYQELIFIPGIFKLAGHYTFSVSKIYVSSQDSRWNGVENWGLPKEVADFSILPRTDSRQETWVVSREEVPFFSVQLRRHGIQFPVNSAWTPFRIGQKIRDTLMVTEPSGRGRGQLVRSTGWYAHPDYFPPLDSATPLVGVSIRDFSMIFPEPRLFRAE